MNDTTTNTDISLAINDVFAQVNVAPGGYELTWTDGIQTESEHFETLGMALGRLALLADCADSDWHSSFTKNSLGHELAWEVFSASELDPR
jgi:hypothetical protein